MDCRSSRLIVSAILWLCLTAAGCSNGNGMHESGSAGAAPLSADAKALIKQARTEPVRVIVRGKADIDDHEGISQVTSRILESARAAGVDHVEVIEGQPLILMRDVSAEQLEALWSSGAVKSIHLDETVGLDPPL